MKEENKTMLDVTENIDTDDEPAENTETKNCDITETPIKEKWKHRDPWHSSTYA